MTKPLHKLSFMVGPTAISQEVYDDLAALSTSRIVEISHRGKECAQLIEETVNQVRAFFKVPNDYTVLFATSATEVWDMMTNCLIDKKSFHFCNGNFSTAFWRCANSWHKEALKDEVEWGTLNDYTMDIPSDAELVSLAYVETSSCVSCSAEDIRGLRERHPDKLLAVDITSAAGTADFEIANADVWYFSVQKGMGLPSGLSLVFVSPKAATKAQEAKKMGRSVGCFQLADNIRMMQEKFQTIQTPNILGIYLLKQQLTRWNKAGGIKMVAQTLAERANRIYAFFENHPKYTPFVTDKNLRAVGVIGISGSEEDIAEAHRIAKEQGIRLGSGYGKLKSTCFRIANYYALKSEDVERLLVLFK